MTYSSEILSKSSGVIKIGIPIDNKNDKYDSNPLTWVVGILQDDIQIQLANNWAPNSEINTALDTLQEFQQIWSTDSVSNYIPTSGMTWKGTKHIVVNVAFYLITFNENSNIQRDARLLAELLTLTPTGVTSTGFHNGYKLNLYQGNERINNNVDLNINDIKGTCHIVVNNGRHTELKGLLASSMQIQPSTVSCIGGEPLYYIVNMGFTGYRAPIKADLKSVFGGK